MRATLLRLALFLSVLTGLAFGQVGNSTITGTVTDQAGAVVPGVTVEVKNAETGVVFRGVTTASGDYTVIDLPVGTYVVSVASKGFKTYQHSNLSVAATQVLRENVALQVGNVSENVTVTDQASLLTTETSEISSNVTLKDLDDLPMLGIGTANSGTTGVRNPYNVLELLPGVTGFVVGQGFGFVVNGQAVETMRIEGQDATSRLYGTFIYDQMAQPSADSIQEMAVQTSNYAAEYGNASSAVINMTMKSGTNQYHGSGYDYFVNEDLNAGDSFSVSGGVTGGSGGKLRPRARRNDFGGTLGGPIRIPKIYNGHDRTFFFWNYEEFLETQQYALTDTVPTPAFLGGDFSGISPNGNCGLCSQYAITTGDLGCSANVSGCAGRQLDALGRPLKANTIYNPMTRGTTAGGLGYATPFLNNVVPMTMFDPLALKLETLFPAATNSNLTSNYGPHITGDRYSAIPSLKIDHNLDAKDKLSFYYSEVNTESQISNPLGSADGLPLEIGQYRGTFIPSYTYRLNYDRTLKPNLLLHLGVGYFYTNFNDHAPFLNFDPSQFGLTGLLIHRQFPSISGMCVVPFGATNCSGYGGMQNIGTSGQIQTQNYEEKPTYTANATWIHGKHTVKIGGEAYTDGFLEGTFAGVTLATGTGPTNQPFNTSVNLNGFGTGFGYASFLLGDYTSTSQSPQFNYKLGTQQWGLYLQDSWKVTRKLTLDYGVRWDLATPTKEQYGRLGQFDMQTANNNAGGHPGATLYASNCNCNFYQATYPYAIGPRFGVAYQINSKTVFRGGWGVVYQFVNDSAGGNTGGALVSTTGTYPLVGINPYVNTQTAGFIQRPVWPSTDPYRYPVLNANPGAAPQMPDANQNRPPRVNQFSAGFQREVTRNFVVEASYVANRAAWTGGGLGFLSQGATNVNTYASIGLYPYPGTGPAGYAPTYAGVTCATPTGSNDCDVALLGQPLSSAAVIAKLKAAGLSSYLPYAGYPTSQSLGSVLRPYPQFGAIGPAGSPTGDNKYDSLQVKATKRLSHGLAAGGTFTWAQEFTRAGRQDFWNPQSSVNSLSTGIPPRVLQFNFTYTVPKMEALNKVRFANTIVKDWQVGGFADYQSAPFLAVPTSPTSNLFASQDRRVPGQPLYLKDINDTHDINPYTDLVLNAAAWTPCAANVTCGTNNVIKNFRGIRHPQENANFGRNFRIKERMNLYIRAEFVNIFNRTLLPQPSTGSPQNLPVKNSAANVYTSGFGTINAYQQPGTATIFIPGSTSGGGPRTGTLIARFTF